LRELRHDDDAAPPSVAESPRAVVGARF